MKMKRILFILWSVIGVPWTFFTYVQWSYDYSFNRGGLPYSELPTWSWWAVFTIEIISGFASIHFLKLNKKWAQYILNAVYVILMPIFLLYVHLIVACHNSDCL